MKIGMFQSIDISRTGLASETKRLKAVAENIANRNTTMTQEGTYYKPKKAVSEHIKPMPALTTADKPLLTTNHGHLSFQKIAPNTQSYIAGGVETDILEMNTEPIRILDPDHPHADPDGYVNYPDIDLPAEMAQAITAIRAYEANSSVISAAKNMFNRALQL